MSRRPAKRPTSDRPGTPRGGTGERPRLALRVRVHGRHPWFFRKMIRKPERPVAPGSVVDVVDKSGRPVGVGVFNGRCDLALRMLAGSSVGEDADSVLGRLLDEAIRLRVDLLQLPRTTDVWRLAHSEGDGFPGLVLDVLGNTVVAQLFSLGMQRHIERIGERLLAWRPGLRLVLTRDDYAAQREGMDPIPPARAGEDTVQEHGLPYRVYPGRGHKTGFFADQRENRQRVRSLAAGRRVLDLFCNSGGFGINALAGGAREVVAADLDEEAVAHASDNAQLGRKSANLDPRKYRAEHADAFDLLRETRRGAFDLIVVDPPKWATGAGEVDDAIQRYEDINRLAFDKVERGGLVATFSCSGAVSEGRFLAALRTAAAKAGRDVRLLYVGGAGPDHPVALEVPQTRYLKAAIAEVR